MLTSSCYVALFLALAFAFCNASADHVRLQDNQTMNDNDQVRISLYVAMPPQGYMVMINCNHGGMIFVRAGRTFDWFVPRNQVTSCQAMTDSSTTFDAYSRQDYAVVWETNYLMVKPDGIYHSYDKVYWEKRANWK